MTKEIKATRRIISLIMCLLMIVSIMPLSASAAGEKVGGVRAEATQIHNVSGAYMPEFTTLKALDPSGADTGYMPSASYLYTQRSGSSYNVAYQLKTAPEEGVTYYAYIQIPTSTGGNDVNASLVKIEITGYDIKYTGMNFSGSNLYINYTIRKTARVCGVEAEASGVKYDSTLDEYAPEFTKLESVTANGSATGYDASTGALYESYNAGTLGNKLTTAPVEGAIYYSYINLKNPLGVHYVEGSLVDIEISGYDVEFIGAYERDMGFRIQVIYKLTKISRVCGVEAEASGVQFNNAAGAYAPVFTKLESVMANGSATGYDASTGALYESYNVGTLSNKLTTAPVEGETYYSYIDLENPEGNHHIVDSLVDIEIPGYDVEFIGAYERDMGFRIQVVYSVRKTARVCGVEAEASGVVYNSSLGGYSPVFTKLESVMSNGSATGYDANTGALYESYNAGTLGNKLTTAPVDGATYYSYIDLDNPLGVHYVEDSLVDIEIPGYDVEFIGAYERDMGFNIQVVYKLTKIALVKGVKAEEGAVWYRTSENAYVVEFDKLTSIGTNGYATGYEAEAGALYKSYTAGSWGDILTTTPVDGATYYSYIDLENPLGIYYIEDSLVDIEIPGYNVEFIGAYERDMGFRIQVVYKLTKQYTRVTGLKAVASGVQFNNTAGAYAPVFTTLNALAANGAVQAYDIEGAVLYKSYNGTAFSDALTTAPVAGEKYYSYIRFENPEGNLDIESALVNISVAGYEVEYIASYERDMGFNVIVVYSLVHNTHTGGTATCKEKAKCTVCGKEYGSLAGHSYNAATCTKAKTCKVCGATSGSKLGHTYDNACDKTCNVCSATRSISHTYKTTTTKATLSANGSIVKKCTVCENVASKTTINYVKSVTLSATSYTYNGSVKTPTVTVKDSAGKVLTKDTDYTVTYASGRKTPGTYNVTVNMKGNYTGTKTLSFKINPIDISACDVKLSATSYTYNGSVKTPTVTVTNPYGTKLTKDVSYTVTYASGRKTPGTYNVTVKMKGYYTGTKTLSFKINPINISTCNVKLSATSFTYNGNVRNPYVTVTTANGTKLTKDTHYTVTYATGRKNAGTYNVTVKMKGNYTGTKTLSFKINPIDISSCDVKLSATSFTYNGNVRNPYVTVTTANGTKLTKDTHYTVSYASGRKNVGTYKVTVTMKGNYKGTKTLTFKINPPATTVASLTAGTKSITVNLNKKTTQTTGYQIQYSTNKDFTNAKTKLITSNSTVKTTLTGLTANKTYYVRVRTYKTVNDVKYYSGWSAYKYVKTK